MYDIIKFYTPKKCESSVIFLTPTGALLECMVLPSTSTRQNPQYIFCCSVQVNANNITGDPRCAIHGDPVEILTTNAREGKLEIVAHACVVTKHVYIG